MNYSIEINRLVEYIENQKDFNVIRSNSCFYNNHLGAILADIVLQSGLNYKSVVLPRVLNIYKNHDSAHDLKGLLDVINNIGISHFLSWNNEIKINRFYNLIEYLIKNKINTTYQLAEHLKDISNIEQLLAVNGIGNKTIDYFLKLMHIETIAVDRHIIGFLNKAEVNFSNYHSAKKIVEYTADILNVSRRDIDYSIWFYMSEKKHQQILQLEF